MLKKYLIIDDDDYDQRLIKKALIQYGADEDQIVCESNARSAVSKIAESPNLYSVIFMDGYLNDSIGLPQFLQGPEAVGEIRRITKDVFIVMTSTDEKKCQAGIAYGANDVKSKAVISENPASLFGLLNELSKDGEW